ncbi:uncharacterized protein LY79DRAFT_693278, partial [Colletotrichum navitas]
RRLPRCAASILSSIDVHEERIPQETDSLIASSSTAIIGFAQSCAHQTDTSRRSISLFDESANMSLPERLRVSRSSPESRTKTYGPASTPFLVTLFL